MEGYVTANCVNTVMSKNFGKIFRVDGNEVDFYHGPRPYRAVFASRITVRALHENEVLNGCTWREGDPDFSESIAEMLREDHSEDTFEPRWRLHTTGCDLAFYPIGSVAVSDVRTYSVACHRGACNARWSLKANVDECHDVEKILFDAGWKKSGELWLCPNC
jgi:hypothetical protein